MNDSSIKPSFLVNSDGISINPHLNNDAVKLLYDKAKERDSKILSISSRGEYEYLVKNYLAAYKEFLDTIGYMDGYFWAKNTLSLMFLHVASQRFFDGSDNVAFDRFLESFQPREGDSTDISFGLDAIKVHLQLSTQDVHVFLMLRSYYCSSNRILLPEDEKIRMVSQGLEEICKYYMSKPDQQQLAIVLQFWTYLMKKINPDIPLPVELENILSKFPEDIRQIFSTPNFGFVSLDNWVVPYETLPELASSGNNSEINTPTGVNGATYPELLEMNFYFRKYYSVLEQGIKKYSYSLNDIAFNYEEVTQSLIRRYLFRRIALASFLLIMIARNVIPEVNGKNKESALIIVVILLVISIVSLVISYYYSVPKNLKSSSMNDSTSIHLKVYNAPKITVTTLWVIILIFFIIITSFRFLGVEL